LTVAHKHIDIKTIITYKEDKITAKPERSLNHYSRIRRRFFEKGIFNL
jgi:hypothetical protein